MLAERYFNRLIRKQLKSKSIDPAQLDHALEKSIAALEGKRYELGHRILLNAIFAYKPNGELLDLGGGCNLYQLILAHLGMKVHIVDFAFDADLKPIFTAAGIKLTESDLYAFAPEENAYDVISTYECFEHLPHSPKRIIDKVVNALKPGGNFVISVPNVSRFEQRWRVFIGRTPHEKYDLMYHSGDYFAGHHREMTVSEMRYLMESAGLGLEELFTTDMTVESLKRRRWLKKFTHDVNYRFLLTDAFFPLRLRKHIWARGVKS